MGTKWHHVLFSSFLHYSHRMQFAEILILLIGVPQITNLERKPWRTRGALMWFDCGWRDLGTNWETIYRTTLVKRVDLLTFSLDIYWYLLSSSRRREGHKRAIDKSIDCHDKIKGDWRTFIQKCLERPESIKQGRYCFNTMPVSLRSMGSLDKGMFKNASKWRPRVINKILQKIACEGKCNMQLPIGEPVLHVGAF